MPMVLLKRFSHGRTVFGKVSGAMTLQILDPALAATVPERMNVTFSLIPKSGNWPAVEGSIVITRNDIIYERQIALSEELDLEVPKLLRDQVYQMFVGVLERRHLLVVLDLGKPVRMLKCVHSFKFERNFKWTVPSKTMGLVRIRSW